MKEGTQILGGDRKFSRHHFPPNERARVAARHLPACTSSALGLVILPCGRVTLEKQPIRAFLSGLAQTDLRFVRVQARGTGQAPKQAEIRL